MTSAPSRAPGSARLGLGLAAAAAVVIAVVVVAILVNDGEPGPPLPDAALPTQGLPQEGNRLGSAGAPVAVDAWIDLDALGSSRAIDRLLTLLPSVRSGDVRIRLEQWDVLGVQPPAAAIAAAAAERQGRYWEYVLTFTDRYSADVDEPRQLGALLPEIARDTGLDVERWERERRAIRDRFVTGTGDFDGSSARPLGFDQPPAVDVRGPRGERQFAGRIPSGDELERAIAAVR